MNIQLSKPSKRPKGRSWFRYGVVVFLLMSLFVGQLTWKSIQIKQTVSAKQTTWVERISQIVNASDKGSQELWSSTEQDIQISMKPITNITGDSLLQYELDRTEVLILRWNKAVQPLEGINFLSGETEFTTISNTPPSDLLAQFFADNADLVQETKRWWNGALWWRVFAPFSSVLKKYVAFVEVVLKALDFVFDKQNNILDALGHYARKTYVIITQNSGEARPTGGFIGVYIPLTVIKGVVEIGDSESIYTVNDAKRIGALAHPAATYYVNPYNNPTEQGMFNLIFFPCWPDSASIFVEEFEQSLAGYGVDGLISVTPHVLQSILPENFSASVPGVGVLNASNIIDEIERSTSIDAPDKKNPKSLITPILKSILAADISVVETARIMLELTRTRDVMLWSKNDAQQEILSHFSLTGEQSCQNKYKTSVITPLIGNISGDKRNAITDTDFRFQSKSVVGGTEIDLDFSQYLPKASVLERPISLATSFTFVGIQVPSSVSNISIEGGLDLPISRDYYKQYIDDNAGYKVDLKEYPSIKKLYAAEDIANGFIYEQPDGSKVIGTYIYDNEEIHRLKFRFTLAQAAGSGVVFYGQPGMDRVSLELAGNAQALYHSDQKLIENRDYILQGTIIKL
jgi:hypothetical protein